MHVVDLPALRGLMPHDGPHRRQLGLGIGAQPAHRRGLPFRVGQDQRAGQPLDRLQGDRPLPPRLLAAALPPRQQLGVARLGLGQAPFGAGGLVFRVIRGAADLVIDALQHLGQRQLDVAGDAVDLGHALGAHLVQERRQRALVEPAGRLREGRRGRQLGGSGRRAQVAEQVRPAQARLAAGGQLHREQPFVDHAAQAVHDARAVAVEARRRGVRQRVEAGAAAAGILPARQAMPAQRLEQRMAGGDPFQRLPLRGVAVGGEPRVARGQRRQLPVRVALVPPQRRRRAPGIEGVRHAAHRPQRQGRAARALGDEAGDRLRHHSPLLRAGAALDQQVQVELAGGQSFQGGPADRPEAALVHVAQQPLLQVGVAQLAGVVVAQHALHLRGRQHLAHHVEHRVVVEGIADLPELVQQPPQHAAFDGVGRHEVEDQAVAPLPVAVDAAHALLQPVRVPRDVVVEQDVAALQVDAFAGRLGGDQHLDLAVAEPLLGVQPRPRFVARARLHAAVDAARGEAPRREPLQQVIERVPELGEDQQPLIRPVEEPLIPHDRPQPAQLRLAARGFDRLRLPRQAAQLGRFLPHLRGVAGQRDRLQDALQPFALGVFELVELLLVGKLRRRRAQQLAGAAQSLLQAPRPVFERPPQGMGARRQAPLVQRHQESHGARPRVVVLRRGAGALPFHEARDRAVEIVLGAVDGEAGGTRDALGEYRPGGPGAVLLPLREVDHRLLGAAQVERGAPLLHRPADRGHVGVGVPVEELQEQREVAGVALVRGGGQQQHVIGAVAQQLAQPVALALVGLVPRRHAVRLVDDHQVPAHLRQAGQDVGALGQVERGDDLPLLQPLVDAELAAQVGALQHDEPLLELLVELALPLERQVRGADHQDAFDQPAQLELADQEAGHDRLAGAGVVGQQEAHARQLEEVFVDRFELMRQRVHP